MFFIRRKLLPIEWSAFQGSDAIVIIGTALAGFGLVALVVQLVVLFGKKARRPGTPTGAAVADLPLSRISFRQFFAQNSSAMLLIEPVSGAILDANPAANRLYGSERGVLLRTTLNDIMQLSPGEIERAVQQVLEGQCNWFTFPFLPANGSLCMVEGHFLPLVIDEKKLLCTTLHDITERIQAEEALKANEAYYHALVEASPDAVTLFSKNGTIIACNPQSAALYRFAAMEDMLGTNFFALFPAEGRVAIREKVFQSLRESREKSFECIMLRANGSTFHSELSVSILLDPSERVEKVIAITRDISQRKEMEAALKENETRYRIVAENTYDWEFWQTPDLELIYSSPSCKRVTGYNSDDFLHDPGLFHRIIYPEDRAAYNSIQRAFREKREPAECEFRIVAPDGEVRWISQVVQPVFDDQGFFMGLRGSNRDVTQRRLIEDALQENEARLRLTNEQLSQQMSEIEQLHQELRDQALRDPLTGLYNRRYLSETLPRELSRATRDNQPMSFIMMDIDHFKTINDTYGHQLGDVFLQKIAHQIRSNTRSSDVACRFGGEEFLLVLLGANEIAAMNRAEDIRAKCAAIGVAYKDEQLHITLSLGVATYPLHGLNEETLLNRADVAMYRSKSGGRNRVTMWHE
jgi:diguanylate cyclase (GGDEF)-like protein/PAS domain S-box-containing protein